MNDIDFFATIVLPCVSDFSKSPGDIRLGVLACVVLQAMNEHYFYHNKFDPRKVYNCNEVAAFKGALRAHDVAFGKIMDIANGTKHATKKFFDLHREIPAACGILRAGFPLSPERYVFIDGDNVWLLYQLTEHVAEAWKARLGSAA